MESVDRDLYERVDRLESDFGELGARLEPHGRREAHGASVMRDISFGVWLKISGPIFAALVCGFTLLWDGQQALWSGQQALWDAHQTTQGHLIEISRSVSRLEGAVAALDDRVDRLGDAVERLSDRLTEHSGS